MCVVARGTDVHRVPARVIDAVSFSCATAKRSLSRDRCGFVVDDLVADELLYCQSPRAVFVPVWYRRIRMDLAVRVLGVRKVRVVARHVETLECRAAQLVDGAIQLLSWNDGPDSRLPGLTLADWRVGAELSQGLQLLLQRALLLKQFKPIDRQTVVWWAVIRP